MKQLLILLLTLTIFSCTSNMTTSTESGGPGLKGTVLRGPTCPVESETDPCPDEPFSALFHVFNMDEEEVTTFTSTAEGLFQVSLAVGDYLVVPDETAPIIQPSLQAKDVTVSGDGFTEVTLLFDTGIQ